MRVGKFDYPQRSHTPTTEKAADFRDARVRLLRSTREDTTPPHHASPTGLLDSERFIARSVYRDLGR